MKRLSLSIILGASSVFSCFASYPLSHNDLFMKDMKGKVKSVTEFFVDIPTYGYTDSLKMFEEFDIPSTAEREPFKYYEFNDDGMVVLEKNFRHHDYDTFVYDQRNKRLYVVKDRYDFDGSLSRRYRVDIDNEGYPVYGLATGGDGEIIFEENYKKQKNAKTGEITLTISINSKNSGVTVNKFTFGANGKLKSISTKSDRVEQTFILNAAEMPVKMIEEYSTILGKQKEVRQVEYLPKQKNIYLIDDKSNKTLISREILDEFGNPVEIQTYQPDGNVDETEVIKYTYDPQGNWLRKVTFKDSKPSSVYERVIVYY